MTRPMSLLVRRPAMRGTAIQADAARHRCGTVGADASRPAPRRVRRCQRRRRLARPAKARPAPRRRRSAHDGPTLRTPCRRLAPGRRGDQARAKHATTPQSCTASRIQAGLRTCHEFSNFRPSALRFRHAKSTRSERECAAMSNEEPAHADDPGAGAHLRAARRAGLVPGPGVAEGDQRADRACTRRRRTAFSTT